MSAIKGKLRSFYQEVYDFLDDAVETGEIDSLEAIDVPPMNSLVSRIDARVSKVEKAVMSMGKNDICAFGYSGDGRDYVGIVCVGGEYFSCDGETLDFRYCRTAKDALKSFYSGVLSGYAGDVASDAIDLADMSHRDFEDEHVSAVGQNCTSLFKSDLYDNSELDGNYGLLAAAKKAGVMISMSDILRAFGESRPTGYFKVDSTDWPGTLTEGRSRRPSSEYRRGYRDGLAEGRYRR